MLLQNRYFPLVKWKRGEQAAISILAPSVKKKITPIIEVVPIPRDLKTGEQTRSLEAHMDTAVNALEQVWGNSDTFYLDCDEISSDQSAANVYGPGYTFSNASNQGLNFIPVVGLKRDHIQIDEAKKHNKNGLCIRIDLNDLESGTLSSDLEKFIENHNISFSDIDLILDMGSVEEQRSILVENLANTFFRSIPNISAWRNLIMLASAFPTSMGIVQKNGTKQVDRVEWSVWKKIIADSLFKRLPHFGDYGIQHPDGVEDFNPLYMTPSAAIRYTLDETWLLIKGESMKQGGAQFRGLSKLLMSTDNYYGSTHCEGCTGVQQCASGELPAKSLEVWRKLGTAHHYTVVVEQLDQLSFQESASTLQK